MFNYVKPSSVFLKPSFILRKFCDSTLSIYYMYNPLKLLLLNRLSQKLSYYDTILIVLLDLKYLLFFIKLTLHCNTTIS